jgi:glycosyltransferase involved in cell wall biosynthesis
VTTKIALDSWVLSSRFRNHGIYVYTRSLFRELARAAPHQDVEFCLFTSPDNHNDASELPCETNFHHRPAQLLQHKHLWRLTGACRSARAEKADLLFAPSATVLASSIPMVCTIHDATPLVRPSSRPAVNLMQRILLRSAAAASRAIITVSQCSKWDLVKLLRVPESRITVIYPGYDKASFNPGPPDGITLERLLMRLHIRHGYILHHGVIQPRKNLPRLIEAYRSLVAENRFRELDLVLAGPLGWEVQPVLECLNRSSNRGKVVLTGELAQHELAMLVKGATLAVIPSLYEGFCLPLVESMACGTPAIAANASCLPEVSGSTLVYFNPLSVDEIAACMKRVLDDAQLRRDISERGKAFVARYEWQHCADATLQLLKASAA